MRKHQIVILASAVSISLATFLGIYFLKEKNEVITVEPTHMNREYSTVKVFFSNNLKDPETLNCDKTYPVERAVSRMTDNGKSALAEYTYLALSQLLDGPAGYEKENGYFTSINQEAKVQKIIIESGVATVDFSAIGGSASGGNEWTGGSCKVQAIRSQIEETLKQFPEVTEVKISINGKFDEVLQP